MRVAIFTDTYPPQVNGVAKTYRRLVSYLVSQNVKTMVFAPAGSGDAPPEDTSAAVMRLWSYDFFLYPECKISLPNYLHIKAALHRFRPDLIHIATPFPIGLAGMKYANDYGVPKVAAFHTNFPQYLQYYHLQFLQNLAWRFLQWFHNQASVNYCPSRETMHLLQRRGIANLELWSRGVDRQLFHPGRRSAALRRSLGVADKLVLLYVGRLAPEKSVDILLQALRTANHQCAGLHLLVVGDGPCRRELEAVAPENVTFLGYKYGEDLARLYASADIFVCPSVTETFGNVVLEAMAAGLPVIAPLAGGIKQNLLPGKTGLPCLPLNALSMAAQIVRLAADAPLRHALATQASRHAAGQTWEAVFSRLLDSYRQVVAQHQGRLGQSNSAT